MRSRLGEQGGVRGGAVRRVGRRIRGRPAGAKGRAHARPARSTGSGPRSPLDRHHPSAVNALLRLLLLGFRMWIAFGGEHALNAPMATRIGVVLLFAALSIVLGEIAQQREHIGLIMKMLRAGGANRRDDKEAIDILIQGLSAREATTREK